MDASQRGNLLFKVADLIERDLDYLAVSEIIQSGKSWMFQVGKGGGRGAVSCLVLLCATFLLSFGLLLLCMYIVTVLAF